MQITICRCSIAAMIAPKSCRMVDTMSATAASISRTGRNTGCWRRGNCSIISEICGVRQSVEVYHTYWHPHNFTEYTEINFRQLERFLACYQKQRDRYGMQSLNMSELCRLEVPDHI